ncbi:sugar-binding transcriptional regulator [Pelagibacterium lentulum]|uniref:Transcriptional regulator n=1 Tax=Pelagibacterium lentulum TaxID=2029865 RepID=A0A916RBJ5_9HYPH|nr:sugar-binding transcriptional regulator [Pelagibacterium lentulum]GGA48345.1 transcriptional regulator [Pelagibacterium lentulum]
MARLRGETNRTLSSAASLRLRAAWLYFNQKMTQKEIGDRLGVSRATVMRMLEEAQRRNEVQIWISEGIDECIALAIELEKSFSLDEAVVVPTSQETDDPSRAVGAALGRFLSETVAENMTLGVGWGRTLTASLDTFAPMRRDGVKVVSLLGGLIHPRHTNPVEYSWRLASLMDAECYFFLAPLIVDSIDTKRTLIEKCGLETLIDIATKLDVAVISCGNVTREGASLARDFVTADELRELIAAGSVCDVMCNFLDAQGRTVDHPVNQRVMSVDLDTMGKAGHVVLATGGQERAGALRATMQRLDVNTLITDEGAARALLDKGVPSQ